METGIPLGAGAIVIGMKLLLVWSWGEGASILTVTTPGGGTTALGNNGNWRWTTTFLRTTLLPGLLLYLGKNLFS